MSDNDGIKNEITGIYEEGLNDAEEYMYGSNSTHAGESFQEALGGLIQVDEDAEACVDEDLVTLYWNAVLGMFGVLAFTLLMAFFFSCCSKRCAGRWYEMMAVVHLIMGALLASFFVPTCNCPGDDPDDICSAHKYNPGPVWGAMFCVVGILLGCRGCCMVRGANRASVVEAEGSKLLAQEDHAQWANPDNRAEYKDDGDTELI